MNQGNHQSAYNPRTPNAKRNTFDSAYVIGMELVARPNLRVGEDGDVMGKRARGCCGMFGLVVSLSKLFV